MKGNKKRRTTATFIADAQALHGKGKYDYSLVDFKKMQAKITIGCAAHGWFEQMPQSHLKGFGCKKCGTGPPCLSIELALSRLKAVHGESYIYYLDSKSFKAAGRIHVECKKHGSFYPKYMNHLNGTGCPKCAGQGLSRREWIERFKAAHGSKFDYSLLPTDISARGMVDIICPQHGIFSQRAYSHHAGNGCLQCRHANKQIGAGGWGKSRWFRIAEGRVCKLYCVRFESDNEVFFKVGITSESLERRFGRIAEYKVFPLFCYESNDPELIWDLEHSVKRAFKEIRYVPRLTFGGCRECYLEIEQIISFLKSSIEKAPP